MLSVQKEKKNSHDVLPQSIFKYESIKPTNSLFLDCFKTIPSEEPMFINECK